MAVTAVPKILREKLGEDEADFLIELINKSEKNGKEDTLKFIEEKFEKRLTIEASNINDRITTEISKVHEHITTEIAKINENVTTKTSKIDNKISETKTEIIKWMFIFWIGQIGVMLGILFTFFKR